MLPLAFASFVSTLFIGPFFDKVGRRKLLLLTCIFGLIADGLSGIILITSYQIDNLALREISVVILFIFASPAGSSANLIAS
jgi:MFS family permease